MGLRVRLSDIIETIGNRGPDSMRFVNILGSGELHLSDESEIDGDLTMNDYIQATDGKVLGYSSVLHLRGGHTFRQPYHSTTTSNLMLYNGEIFHLNR